LEISLSRLEEGDREREQDTVASQTTGQGPEARDEQGRMELEGKLEDELWSAGLTLVGGVDEAGRGPIAGPVVAAAVVLEPGLAFEARIDDSKILSPKQRMLAFTEIEAKCRAFAWGSVGPRFIDRTNILYATMHAMARAIRRIELPMQRVLIDGQRTPGATMFEEALVGGDGKSITVAAASIVAKVVRDSIMTRLDGTFPQYGFADHKGYCTPAHVRALSLYGPCVLHRRSFSPVRDILAAAA
jgi:ribonuclease HII